MKKYIGIWIDAEKAYLVELDQGRQMIVRIDSPVEDFHVRGGSRSNVPYGPQDNVSESKMRERRRRQFQVFFGDIISHIPQAAALYLMGPADTRLELEKEIRKVHAFDAVPISNEAADSMTTNQLAAQVREHFQISHSWADHSS
jgi:hypothetical protein